MVTLYLEEKQQNGNSPHLSSITPSPKPRSRNELFKILSPVVLGSTAGIPYFAPAYRAAQTKHALGIAFGMSTVIVYGGGATWGWHNIIEEWSQKYNAGEFKFSYLSVKQIGGSCVLAFCSSSIDFYTVHKYNNNSLFLPTITFINYFGYYAAGYYKLISFVTSDRRVVNEIDALNHSDCEIFLKKLIMVFPLGNLIVNSYLSFEAADKIFDNEVVALPFALLALATFALESFSAYELVAQYFAKKDDEALALTRIQYLGKLLFLVLSLTLLGFATSSEVFIAQDNIGANAAGYILETLAVGSGLIFGQYVLNDLANKGVMLFSSRSPERDSRRLENHSDEQTRLLTNQL